MLAMYLSMLPGGADQGPYSGSLKTSNPNP